VLLCSVSPLYGVERCRVVLGPVGSFGRATNNSTIPSTFPYTATTTTTTTNNNNIRVPKPSRVRPDLSSVLSLPIAIGEAAIDWLKNF